MGVETALYSGVSGLNATSTAMNVIGNNLANSQTTGYKSDRSLFSDILANKVASANASSQVGRGVELATVDTIFEQGTFQETGMSTDMAIDGDGFFMVSQLDQDVNRYTRDGSFRLNEDGYLVNSTGYRVQGYDIDTNGNIDAQLSDIHLNLSGSVAPLTTTEASFDTNLNADATIVGPFDPSDPNGTSNFSASINVYDSLGSSHQVTVYFDKKGTNSWNFHITASADEVDTPPANTKDEIVVFGTGKLEFDEDGRLINVANIDIYDNDGNIVPGSTTVTLGDLADSDAINWNNGANASALDITLGQIDVDRNIAGLTQYDKASSLVSKDQNGYSSGTLEDVSVNQLGVITGSYSNGQSRQLAQVGLAKFANPNGLLRDGNNLFAATQASGMAAVGAAGSGAGTIRSNSLEQSNVDIAEQFTDMILTQRIYQANSRTITTADEMLQEVVNLKR
jgi:flagellar hook protein FlgE